MVAPAVGAVVLAEARGGDWLLCQITSNPYGDPRAIELTDADFARGSLKLTSYARPAKLFTANRSLIIRQVGQLHTSGFEPIAQAIIQLI